MITRELILAEARSWIGTKVLHQGQKKGLAADCKGLTVGVCLELGMPEGECLAAKVRDYNYAFRGRSLYDGLRASLISLRAGEEQPADLLAILWGRDPFPRHLAFVSDQPGWIIHAYGGRVAKVEEVPLAKMRVHSRFTWPSLGQHG